MGAFEYTALDERGKQQRGVLEGDAPRQIRQQLRERGLTPLEVQEVSSRKRGSIPKFSLARNKISVTELALFTRQLATLVKAGLPLEASLQATSQQTDNPRTERVALGIRARILEGHTFADALSDFPQVFPEIYRATVAAGEQSGRLDGVLERLADYVENQQAMRQKVQLALLYPVILTFVAIGVVVVLLAKVVPDVVGVFDSIDAELPALTKGLIATSDFLSSYGLILLVLLIVAGIAWRMALREPHIRRAYDLWVLKIPVIGRLVLGVNTGRFTRTLSILVNSGVPVLDALQICVEVVSSLPMKSAVTETAQRVREGSTIYDALNKHRLFPAITLHLIANGEASGDLGGMLERAAVHQEREVETLVGALMGLFEPLLILVMGGVVLLIVLAILLPIFEINQLVK